MGEYVDLVVLLVRRSEDFLRRLYEVGLVFQLSCYSTRKAGDAL